MKQQMLLRDKLDSEVIKLLRFPLAMMVVALHAEPSIQGWDITKMSSAHLGANVSGCVMYSISHILTQIAVPCFFLISGYLFFKKLEIWDKAEFLRKIHSRILTLLIPYLLWVGIFCFIHIVGHILPNCTIVEFPSMVKTWIGENGGLLNLFWSSSVWTTGANNIFNQKVLLSGPQPFHLWFIRDLFVMVLLSPIFYILFCRKASSKMRVVSVFSILLLMVCYLLQVQLPFYVGVGFASLFYFGLGAFFSLNRYSLIDFFVCYRFPFMVVAMVLFFVLIPMDGSRTKCGIMLIPIWTIAGVGTLFPIAVKCISIFGLGGVDNINKISKASFFMYMIHPFILSNVWSVLSMVLCKVFHVVNISDLAFADVHPVVVLLSFIIKVLITILISILIYIVFARFFPRVSKIICGR